MAFADHATGRRRRPLPLASALLGLMAWSVALAALSHQFRFDRGVLEEPVALFVALQSAAGLLYLFTLWLLRRHAASRRLILVLLVVGSAMRLSQFQAAPILETDFFRYLWDGALTAHGLDPYRFTPNQVLAGDVPPPWRDQAAEAGAIVHRINHPWLRTIYPPTAQAAFALAHWIAPFSLDGLRAVWFLLDSLIVLMILTMLRGTSRMALGVGIYALNPLLIKEVYNAGHMEPVLLAALTATLLAARAGRPSLTGVSLGLAVGAKVWPVLWLPLVLRAAASHRRAVIVCTMACALTFTLMAWPIVRHRMDDASGFGAYAKRWQMNDSVYLLVHSAIHLLTEDHAQLAARGLIAAVLVTSAVVLALRRSHHRERLIARATIVTAMLFLLSPTQFPWYFLWLMPLLALREVWSLLALTVTLPIYYLRMPMAAADHAVWFDYGLIWLQFAPIWVMLLIEWRWARRRRADPVETPRV